MKRPGKICSFIPSKSNSFRFDTIHNQFTSATRELEQLIGAYVNVMFSKNKRTHEGLTILSSFEPVCERQYLRSILRDAYVNLFLSKFFFILRRKKSLTSIPLKISKMIYWIFEWPSKRIKMIRLYRAMLHPYQVNSAAILSVKKPFSPRRCDCMVTYITDENRTSDGRI